SSLCASRATAAASALDSFRSPWSTVTATSSGLVSSESRHCAAMTMSAVESGPPETASTRTGKDCSPEKSDVTSDAETALASAVRTLLFLRDPALHAGGGARECAVKLGERGARRLFLVHRRERLTKPQQRVRRLSRSLVSGRNVQE